MDTAAGLKALRGVLQALDEGHHYAVIGSIISRESGALRDLLESIEKTQAVSAPPWDHPSNRSHPPVEEMAQQIYDRYPYGGPGKKPEWVPNGNSQKQDEARATARRYLRDEHDGQETKPR